MNLLQFMRLAMEKGIAALPEEKKMTTETSQISTADVELTILPSNVAKSKNNSETKKNSETSTIPASQESKPNEVDIGFEDWFCTVFWYLACFVILVVAFPIAYSVDISDPYSDWDMYRDALNIRQWMRIDIMKEANMSLPEMKSVIVWPHNQSIPNWLPCNEPRMVRNERLTIASLMQPISSLEPYCLARMYPSDQLATECTMCFTCDACVTLQCSQEVLASGCGNGLVPFHCSRNITQGVCRYLEHSACNCNTYRGLHVDYFDVKATLLDLKLYTYGRVEDRHASARTVGSGPSANDTIDLLIDVRTQSRNLPFFAKYPRMGRKKYGYQDIDNVPQFITPEFTWNDTNTTRLTERARSYLSEPKTKDVWIYSDIFYVVRGVTLYDPYEEERIRWRIAAWVLFPVTLVLAIGLNVRLCMKCNNCKTKQVVY